MKVYVRPLVALCLFVAPVSLLAEKSDDATPRPKKTSSAAATPANRKKAAAEDEESTAKISGKKKTTEPTKEDKPDATPKPVARKKAIPEDEDEKAPHKGSDDPAAKPVVPDAAATTHYPAVAIEASELQGFAEQPEPVRRLIEEALSLTKLNLTYKFGSDDPTNGGMDCSGTIAYVLRQHGFKDVPRDASGQYSWARQHGEFFAVISKKSGGFEFSDLLPGDLMFWNGTYNAGDRDPPVTHSMLYLGVEKKRKQPVMFGSSDGRTYDGKARYGVSVFDFHMPKAETSRADFLGYARIPGLRTPAIEKPEAASEKEEQAAAKPPAGSAKKGSKRRLAE